MKALTGVIALILALLSGASNVVLAAEKAAAPAAENKQKLEQSCRDHGGTWTSGRRQGGSCAAANDTAAKKKKTLKRWCKDHGGTWTSDGHQGGSCAL